jgi:pyruvate, water dikinase
VKIFLLAFLGITLAFHSYPQSFLQKLADKADFDKLSGLPLEDKYGRVSAVKVVFDLNSGDLYFINSKNYKYHNEFCSDQLNYLQDLAYFNEVNYSDSPARRFLLANINFFETLNVYALEITPVDLMPVPLILELYKNVSNACFFGGELKMLINCSRLQAGTDQFENRIPLLNASEIYKNLDYQCISRNSAYGILRFVDDPDQVNNQLSPMDIIVIKETPVALPRVAGIIVTEFQTPLSHLTILGQNRKIPISAYKKAFEDETLRALENQKVHYSVDGNSFHIERAEEIIKSAGRRKPIKLEYDLSVDSLVSIPNMGKKAYRYAGNKASNFGILYKLSKRASFKTPETAFVIPFFFYDRHLEESGTSELINRLASDKSILANTDSLQLMLKKIRRSILDAPVDSALIASVSKKIRSLGNDTVLRFRSSTNAEDAKGFSGAGLYTSKTGILQNGNQSIEKAIKQVWASIWSYQAFMEREYFNIDHREVFMAILVHRSFPEEAVNGVAITKNLYRPDYYGFVVNAQLGDESVVKPDSGTICDQFICYPDQTESIYKNKNTVDIITLSNLNNEKPVMTDAEIQNLANTLEKIKRYFYARSRSSRPYLDFGLDIEFKLNGENRELYLKQVRLYND